MGLKLNDAPDFDSSRAAQENQYRTAKDCDYLRPAAATVAPMDAGDQQILQLIRLLFLSPACVRQVTFCGVDRESGSSAVCARVAQMLAEQTKLAVCLIDANPRMRRLTNSFRPSAKRQKGCVQLQSNLWFAEIMLAADSRHDLVPVNQVSGQMKQLAKEFDYLLLDAPGVNMNSDALFLGQMTGAAVLVVEANNTRRTAARKAKQTLEGGGVQVLGTVLHNRSFPIPDLLYRRL